MIKCIIYAWFHIRNRISYKQYIICIYLHTRSPTISCAYLSKIIIVSFQGKNMVKHLQKEFHYTSVICNTSISGRWKRCRSSLKPEISNLLVPPEKSKTRSIKQVSFFHKRQLFSSTYENFKCKEISTNFLIKNVCQ